MNTRTQYKVGAVLSYLTIALNIVMGFAFTPMLQRAFGLGMYGVYGTIGKFVGYMAIMDLGLGNAVIRYVAKYRAEGDKTGMERFLGMVVALYALLGVVICCVGAVCYFQLPAFFPKYTAAEMAMAQKLFLLVLGNMTLSMLLNIFPGVMSAFERFVFMRMVTVIRLLLRAGLLALMLTRSVDPFRVTLLDTGLNLLVMLCYVGYVLGRLKVRVRWGGFDRALLRQIFGYSIFIFLNVIMHEVYWNVDATLVSMLRGAEMAAITVASGNLVNYFMDFSNAISGMYLPRAVQLVTKGASGEALTDMMIRIGRIQLMVISLLVIGFGLAGLQFFTLWVGDTMGASGVATCYRIVLMLMLALLIPMFQNVAISISQAMNKHAFRAVMLSGIAVLNVALSVVLIRLYGPIGAAIGTAASLVVGNTIISNWYYHKHIGLNIPRFFREALRGILPALLLITALGSITFLLPQDSWRWFLARAVIILVLYVGVMVPVGMNDEERALFGETLGGFFRRLKRR